MSATTESSFVMPLKNPGKDRALVIVLVALGLLFIALWFADPLHRAAGKSRAEWPAPTAKP